MGVMLKGKVLDHWTWRDGVPHVTGWHYPERGKREAEVPMPVVPRGLVTTSTGRVKSDAKERQGKLL